MTLKTTKSKAVKKPKAVKKTEPVTEISSQTDAAAVTEGPEQVAEPASLVDGTAQIIPIVRRKEMVERIVARAGLKPNAVKHVLDAVLHELGDALSREETLALPPFGKVTVNRRKETENAEILICKIRRNKAVTSASEIVGSTDEAD